MNVETVVELGTESGVWRFAGQLILGMGFSGQKGQAEPCQGHKDTVGSEETILGEKKKKEFQHNFGTRSNPGSMKMDTLAMWVSKSSKSKPRAHI